MENSELKNTKTTWFRHFLFGRKNKNPYPKKVTFNCCKNCQSGKEDKTVQANIYSYKKEELDVKGIENTKGIQKYAECPGNMFPKERKGCGFHLYFCIDNVRKSDFAKRKKNKKVNYKQTKFEELYQKLDTTKEPLPSNNMTEIIAEIEQTKPSYFPLQRPWTVVKKKSSLRVKYISPRKTTVSQHKNINNKMEENDNRNRISSNLRTEEKTKADSERLNKNTTSKISLTNNERGEPTSKIPVVRISSLQTPTCPENKSTKPLHGGKSQTDFYKSCQGSDQWEEDIFKEYEKPKKPTLRRNTELFNRKSTFVRNSLINLRKDRSSRTSEVEMVTQILLKLAQIEEKITELETSGENKGKKIMNIVGISCNNAKSTMSININSKNSTDEQRKQTRSKSDTTTSIT